MRLGDTGAGSPGLFFPALTAQKRVIMVAALATKPAESARVEEPGTRPSLSSLAALGAEELTAQLSRALPDGDPGQVAVAAFNSSI